MAAARDRKVLGALGVGPAAEDVYRALLTNPGSSVSQLQEATAFGPSRLRSALGELEQNAMITRRGGTPTRFQPAPPDIVVEALISAREDELNQARLSARELATLPRTSPEQLHVTELVEILSSREAVAERWVQLQQATRETLEVFVRPPLAQPAVDEHESLQASLLRRGVVMRTIYDGEAMGYPGMHEFIDRTGTSRRDRVRVVSQLPLKLALSDRQIALIPLTQRDPESMVDSGLIVHRSALLDALIVLFDIYWERATDVATEQNSRTEKRDAAEADTVLTLLAAGLKDEAIARELGVSTHTVRRRIAAICERLGVTTRFQAGLALGREAWPQTDPTPPAATAASIPDLLDPGFGDARHER
jgi:hypothetical protein